VTATAGAVHGVPGRVYNIGGGARVSPRGWTLVPRISGRKVTIDKTGPAQGRNAFAPSVTLEEGLRAMGRWMEATKA